MTEYPDYYDAQTDRYRCQATGRFVRGADARAAPWRGMPATPQALDAVAFLEQQLRALMAAARAAPPP